MRWLSLTTDGVELLVSIDAVAKPEVIEKRPILLGEILRRKTFLDCFRSVHASVQRVAGQTIFEPKECVENHR